MRVNVENLSLNIHGKQILDKLNFELSDNKMIGLLGPNGSGKSTLLRSLCGFFPSLRRAVHLNGISLKGLGQRALARQLSFVPQHAEADPELKVEQLVRLGRNPHRRTFSAWSSDDQTAFDEAVNLTKLEPLIGRYWGQLSGGEKQRCQIARALAQKPEIILLDEPTNHLDIYHQLEIMQLINRLPITAVIALHDLNLAACYCDLLVVIQSGKIVGYGTPKEVLTPESIKSIWNVDAAVESAGDGKVTIQYNYMHQ
ncbi:ABC transporter ATP-binding protein [Klebsiella pneumoniae]|uniref:ABC transporter ATP-binding protein n=1 Tax=Klebsiella pneumoniae TaxID=573 RepID=UPI0029622501|nr:ABC transporter ATP-binding protein [Klebsiella pneumoniae]MDW1257617.1 ABC transporter ATP-binding protein [Klebsiella pneumoniae]